MQAEFYTNKVSIRITEFGIRIRITLSRLGPRCLTKSAGRRVIQYAAFRRSIQAGAATVTPLASPLGAIANAIGSAISRLRPGPPSRSGGATNCVAVERQRV